MECKAPGTRYQWEVMIENKGAMPVWLVLFNQSASINAAGHKDGASDTWITGIKGGTYDFMCAEMVKGFTRVAKISARTTDGMPFSLEAELRQEAPVSPAAPHGYISLPVHIRESAPCLWRFSSHTYLLLCAEPGQKFILTLHCEAI